MKKSILLTLLAPALFSCTSVNSNAKGNWDSSKDTVFRYNVFDATMKEGVSCYRIPALVKARMVWQLLLMEI